MIIKVKLAVTIPLAAGFFYGFFYVNSLRAANARLEQLTVLAQAEAASLKIKLRQNQAALIARANKQAELARENEDVKKQLEILYERDEEAKNWGGNILPDAIIKRLR